MTSAETAAALNWAREMTQCLDAMPVPAGNARRVRQAMAQFEEAVAEVRKAGVVNGRAVRAAGVKRGRG